MTIIHRKNTYKIKIKNFFIGGNNNIYIQSMCNTKTSNITETIKQINLLEKNGCQLIRLAIPNKISAYAIKKIKNKIKIPIIADIHFNYKLALLSIEQGVDKIRINPGNIGEKENIIKIINACKFKKIPIRIGINSGSLNKRFINNNLTIAQQMFENAKFYINFFKKLNFNNIIFSLKSSDINTTLNANIMFAKKFKYPLHIGITEAGINKTGKLKSIIGLSSLISHNIGNTCRISLTDNPIKEIILTKEIFKVFNIIKKKTDLISCPTCARSNFNVIKIANKVDNYLKNINKNIKISILGCHINGYGEAKYTDIGIVGYNKKKSILLKKNKKIKFIKNINLFEEIKKEINLL